MSKDFKKIEKDSIKDIENVISYTLNWADTNQKRVKIQNACGIERTILIGFRNGTKKLANMRYETIIKLISFYIDYLQEDRIKQRNN